MRLCACALVAVAGCVANDAEPERALEVETSPAETHVHVVGADGHAEPAWQDKLDVFLVVDSPAPTEYVFRVLDLRGEVVSSDGEACRHFWTDAHQAIVTAGCEHAVTTLGTLPLAPFDDSDIDGDGTMHFVVQIAPVDAGFATSSLKATFAIAAWPSS